MTMPKGYESNSESNLSNFSNFKIFLDVDKKVWRVKDKEFPVIENIPKDKFKVLDDIMITVSKVEAGKMEMTQDEADKIDTKVRENVYGLGLGTDLKTIQSLIPEEEGELFAQVHYFIRELKTIENARQDPTYNPKIRPQSGELNESDLQNNFLRYTWQQAEDLVGQLFKKKGYSVTVTQRSADFGIDVEARNTEHYLGIQVKHWNGQVGFEDVAKTLGVAQKFNKVIIVNTKSGFTSQAWTHAKDNPYLIELWDSEKFKDELRQNVLKN